MRGILRWICERPLRLLGTLIVLGDVTALASLMMIEVMAGPEYPYLGILTYMILPGPLFVGLVLVPLDGYLYKRAQSGGKHVYPRLDLNDPYTRTIATFFAACTLLICLVMSVVGYRALEFMDTRVFCGKVCHKVMIPEYTAYMRSAHKSVNCVPCHIGPGAPSFVRAKLTGLPQVYHSLLGDYVRPVETPVTALRPSRDTCENCHRVDQFYGSLLVTRIHYLSDEANTRQVHSMVMRIGSGGLPGSGIHGHMVGKFSYLPADRKRTEIASVSARRPDGTLHEWTNPLYATRLEAVRKDNPERVMDCIDCHNRAAHDFRPFADLLDDAITGGRVAHDLPFLRREALAAAGPSDTAPTWAEQARTLASIAGIKNFYDTQYPDVARTRAADIDRSVKAVSEVYSETFFPHMGVGPTTYPNLRTHNGCFRCHGVMERPSDNGAKTTLSAQCDLCHSEAIVGPQEATLAPSPAP
jgi:hypothetical protein